MICARKDLGGSESKSGLYKKKMNKSVMDVNNQSHLRSHVGEGCLGNDTHTMNACIP